MRFPNLSLFPFSSKKKDDDSEFEYASFSARIAALVVDMLLLFLFLTPVFEFLSRLIFPEFYQQGGLQQMQGIIQAVVLKQISFGTAIAQFGQIGLFEKMAVDYTLQVIVSGLLIVFAWTKYHKTPGYFLCRLHVADAKTGDSPLLKQYIIRYCVGVIAIVPFTLGMFTMFFNQRKMALHDYAAQTVVLRRKFRFKKKAEASEDEGERLGE